MLRVMARAIGLGSERVKVSVRLKPDYPLGPTRVQGMSPDIDISLQLPIDPSDSKGLAILNKHTLMRFAQIFYQKETSMRQARCHHPVTGSNHPTYGPGLLAYLHSQQMIKAK
jgi:hypothetical protein